MPAPAKLVQSIASAVCKVEEAGLRDTARIPARIYDFIDFFMNKSPFERVEKYFALTSFIIPHSSL